MFRRRTAGALIALAAILIVPAAASAQSVTGADVSQWQGTIDWTRVGHSGIRFVFVKATEGTTFTDPAFARNRDGARSAGLAVGFYHFADPQGSTVALAQRDAAAEAAHFLAVYQPRPTDLRPVLDIERTGGLSPARLQAWVSTWVHTVHRRLHTQPFIYTGHPALALPVGKSPAGLPASMQLVGRFFDDPLLMRVAYAYQHSTDWDKIVSVRG